MELMNSIKVLGVGSSMREGSHGTRTLKIVLDMIKRYDAKTPSFIAAIIHLCNHKLSYTR